MTQAHVPDTILLVQSAHAHLCNRAVAALRRAYPTATLTVLVAKGMRDQTELVSGVEYIDNRGSQLGLVRQLRGRRFESVYVVYSNEAGFWKLKLLPFALQPKHLYAINENLDWFPVDLENPELLVGHLRWRLEGHTSVEGLPTHALRAVLWPAAVTYLLAYEKSHQARALFRRRS